MRAGENESYLKRYYWQDAGSITERYAGAGELLGADALTHAAVEALADAKKVVIEIPQGWLAVELRFSAYGTEEDENIIELYVAATSDSKPDHYRHFAKLTTLVGTQEHDSNKFIDTVSAVSHWLTRQGAVSPANNTFASYSVNMHGQTHLLAIVSTLNSTSLKIGYKKV